MKVTFHRAIDMAVDPIAAVEDVISARCDKILTSGAASTAMAGASTIRQMIGVGGDRIDVIAAAGLSEDNVLQLLKVSLYDALEKLLQCRNHVCMFAMCPRGSQRNVPSVRKFMGLFAKPFPAQ